MIFLSGHAETHLGPFHPLAGRRIFLILEFDCQRGDVRIDVPRHRVPLTVGQLHCRRRQRLRRIDKRGERRVDIPDGYPELLPRLVSTAETPFHVALGRSLSVIP